MRDYRKSSEALDEFPLKPNLNKLGLQRGPQPLAVAGDKYGFGAKPLPSPLWDRWLAWWKRHTHR